MVRVRVRARVSIRVGVRVRVSVRVRARVRVSVRVGARLYLHYAPDPPVLVCIPHDVRVRL